MTQTTTVKQRTKSQTTKTKTQPTKSILGEYADLRWQMATLEAKLKEIEPLAIDKALEIMNAGETVNGKQIVYRTKTVDITLKFRDTIPKDSEHPDLEHLAEMIEIEETKAISANAEIIAQVQQEIAVLEAKLVSLKNTDEGLEYRAEYAQLQRQLTTKKPILAVKLV